MKILNFILISFLIFLSSCQENTESTREFVYKPSVPYPILNPGDFWLNKFDQRGLQNAVLIKDRIYCNTIDVRRKSDRYLYCLNPENGLVEWRVIVEDHASQSVFISNDLVVYCSFLGEISVFDKNAKRVWKTKFNHPYGGHWVDTTNSKLLVRTVYSKYVSEYDIETGILISDSINDSLQKLIDQKRQDRKLFKNHKYQFEREGNKYTINCIPPKVDKGDDGCIIKIEKLPLTPK